MTKHRAKASAARHRSQAKRRLPLALWIGLSGLLLVVAGIVFLARPGSQAAAVPVTVNGQAKLAVDQDKVDLGVLPLDKTVEVSFKLSNVGDKPLQIQGKPTIDVQKGC